MLIGPLTLGKDSNWDSLKRAGWPREAVLLDFVAQRLVSLEIDPARAKELIAGDPDCCSIEPVTYNPFNWLGWHILWGFRGSPAWLMTVNFDYRKDGVIYRYRTFGRLTNGGRYLTEYSDGGRRIAVQDAGKCPIEKLPSGLIIFAPLLVKPASDDDSKSNQTAPAIEVLELDECTNPYPKSGGAEAFLTQAEQDELGEVLSIVQHECMSNNNQKGRNIGCYDRTIVLSNVNEESLARSRYMWAGWP